MPRYIATCVAVYQYFIQMNRMMGRMEDNTPIGPFESKEEAKAYYNSLLVDPYVEEGPSHFNDGMKKYSKTFQKGSPLEWLNPLLENEWEHPSPYGQGLFKVLVGVEQVVPNGPPLGPVPM